MTQVVDWFRMEQVIDRAARRSRVTDGGCWEFEGALSPDGYGRVGIHGKTWVLHRLAWMVMVDEDLPRELTLDHLCRNKACWNVQHLDPVPIRVNLLRGEAPTIVAFREGRCLRGHPASLMYHHSGRRQCGECAKTNARRRYREAS